jgi:hypothetical protein
LRQLLFVSRFPNRLCDLIAKTETIEQSHQLRAQLRRLCFARHCVKQFGKTPDHERGPGERCRMNVARRTSLLLDAFLSSFAVSAFSTLSAMSVSRSCAPASMFRSSLVAVAPGRSVNSL